MTIRPTGAFMRNRLHVRLAVRTYGWSEPMVRSNKVIRWMRRVA
jgi:hypothetical protein